MVHITSDAVILDNGAYSLRVGTSRDAEPRIIPNCIFKSKNDRKRVYIGGEIEECIDRSGIFYSYSCEKGYLVNWDIQQQVWDKTLGTYLPNAKQSKLILTDLNYLIPAIKDQSYEIIFDHYEFGQLYKTSAQQLSSYSTPDGIGVVIDAGFSCTTVAAFFQNRPIKNAVLRLDLGGKGLTNQLKDWISYRHVNVMEETYVVNECKEDCCFVSLNPDRDMQIAQFRDERNTIRREYILPDFMERSRGYINEPGKILEKLAKAEGQVLPLNHERFMLPEALFRPSNIQIDQMGIAEAVAEVIQRSPKNLRCILARNIVITGGSSKFPNFKERLQLELNSLLEPNCRATFVEVSDPITNAWFNAQEVVNSGALNKRFIRRSDWQEHGDAISKRFYEYIEN